MRTLSYFLVGLLFVGLCAAIAAPTFPAATLYCAGNYYLDTNTPQGYGLTIGRSVNSTSQDWLFLGSAIGSAGPNYVGLYNYGSGGYLRGVGTTGVAMTDYGDTLMSFYSSGYGPRLGQWNYTVYSGSQYAIQNVFTGLYLIGNPSTLQIKLEAAISYPPHDYELWYITTTTVPK